MFNKIRLLATATIAVLALQPVLAQEDTDVDPRYQWDLTELYPTVDDWNEAREEVMAEGLVRNIGNFSRFLEVISFSHGSILNISEVSRECEVSRKTVEGYVSILEDMLLGSRMPVFSKRAKRVLVKQAKFYYFDAGVFRSLRPKGPLDRPEEIDGLALEGLVAQHLRAWCDYTGGHQLFFWRTPGGTEADFVVYGESVFCAIEVKNARTVSIKDVRGLRAFQSDYPEGTVALLYRGTERLLVGGVLCLPCVEFLEALTPGGIRFGPRR